MIFVKLTFKPSNKSFVKKMVKFTKKWAKP